MAVASTTGIRAAEARTAARLLTVTMGPGDGTGYAEAAAVDATEIDADAIGREVGLSRSVLAERFTDLVGMPPMQYLAKWRMQVAAARLASGSSSSRSRSIASRKPV